MMMKRLALAAVVSCAAAGLAVAAEPPANTEACFKTSGDLFESASSVPDDKKEALEKMFEELESQCDAGKFTDAAAQIDKIKAAIGK